MTLKNLHNAIFSQGSAVGATPCDWLGYQMALDFGQDHVLVNPSLLQENKKDLMTKDTSGQFSQNSLTSVNLQSSLENRLKQQLSTDGSILFKMTWKDAATPAHRRYCLLRALAHRTFDTDCIGGGVLSDANSNGLNREKEQQLRLTSSGSSSSNGDSQGIRLERKAVNEVSVRPEGWEAERRQTCQSGPFNQQLANPDSFGCRGRYSQSRLRTPTERFPINGEEQLFSRFNFWSGAEWRLGQDGKIRPVEPGTFPLAYGIPARVGRLRGYGNAIVPQVAAEFIKAFLGALNEF